MVQRIKVNFDTVEAMLFFWQATNDREKVTEKYLNDVAGMEGFELIYDEEFDGESVRRAMSAVSNREPFQSKNKKEGRFWNNNLWMLEDLEYTDAILQPIKKLNLDSIVDEINSVKESKDYETIEVFFVPFHTEEYVISSDKLIINFFRVRPDFVDEKTYIGELEISDFIKEKIIELLK
ncbi:hypothetical protein [Proteiniborus sp. MB09-C3]|uniref:TDE2712 family protein n=1 Tax=Proteiniborus sp. MB09-C3 TaxID=3050072 RepID=UPI0025577785|nr:hypothetical protein [Proteiniborus sp. MB09-C3]WIV11215.1 hypothetical protein QO263_13790 [Proteiniborus sp. MB09-C3]